MNKRGTFTRNSRQARRSAFGRLPASVLICASLGACSQGAGTNADRPAPEAFMTAEDGVRFLARGTFGARPGATARLLQIGPRAWVDEQIQRPASLHFPQLIAEFPCAPHVTGDEDECGPDGYDSGPVALRRHQLWWNGALLGEDQLRQRVAHALGQIMVVSERHAELGELPFLMAEYHDVLVEGAFGSFRDLIEDITLSPAMGMYLGMAGNRKEDPVLNTRPDENFARELMQLFTIGTAVLNPDGSPALVAGEIVPTYDQDTIRATARALTGWTYGQQDQPSGILGDFLGQDVRTGPMVPWPAFHDEGAKTVVGGVVIPAGQSAQADLAAVLDALASHPNCGPYLGKQLIQRLVTSNPSPEYVARVAGVWDDDGTGRRGHLGAVVRAILLDAEALAGTNGRPEFGAVREPLLRCTTFLRAFNSTGFQGGDPYDLEEGLGQGPLTAPSVFNFYSPSYAPPDLAATGLVAPEMQITTHSGLPRQANVLGWLVDEGWPAPGMTDWPGPHYDSSALLSVAGDLEALVQRLERRLLAARLPEPGRSDLIEYVGSIEMVDPDEPTLPPGLWRVLSALTLVLHSPSYAIQK